MIVKCLNCNKIMDGENLSKVQELTCVCVSCLENKDEKIYQKEYAIKLLNRIINESEDLTPEKITDEKFEIGGELYSEVFNFLQNHDLDTFK